MDNPKLEFVLIPRAQITALKARVKELEADNAELEHLFRLERKADARATAMWREQTGKQHILPDRCNLLLFLMDRIDSLEGRRQR
jgi:hypothetical protein